MGNSRNEFEKQLYELKTIVNENCEGNERITELIKWYRKEYQKRPELYPGDEVVVKAIKDNALKGLILDKSIDTAKILLKADLAFTDIQRSYSR